MHNEDVFTHRLRGRLELSVVQLLAVVKDVLICGVETCFHTVPDHMGGTRGGLQFQNLDIEKKTRRHLYKNNVTPANKSIVTNLPYESPHKSLSLTAQRNQSSSQTFYYPLVLYELRQTEMTEHLFKNI